MKKLLVKLLFNQYQRAILWQALQFSNYTYERRAMRSGAVATRKVMNEVAPLLAPDPKPLTREDVEAVVRDVIKEFIDKNDATDVRNENILDKLLHNAEVIDPKQCESCDKRDHCVLFNVVIAPVMELIAEQEKSAAGDDTTEAPEPTTQEPEEKTEEVENKGEQAETEAPAEQQ